MDWLIRMNSAVRYIEDNITQNIDYDKVAEKACCSAYHFQRMFSFITDIPLSEYIRRRRLTLAAYELQNSDVRIIDLAIKYGYDSADSFTRAFQKVHGVSPSLARNRGVELKAYSCMSFQISIKGDVEMNYRIEEKKEFKVFGKSILTTQVDFRCFCDIKEFWLMCNKDGSYERIRNMAGYAPKETINAKHVGSVIYGHKPDGSFKYMIAAELPEGLNVDSLEVLEIPSLTWAVFVAECAYDDALAPRVQSLWKKVPEWLGATGYEYIDAPARECFSFTTDSKIGEIWIPVSKNRISLY